MGYGYNNGAIMNLNCIQYYQKYKRYFDEFQQWAKRKILSKIFLIVENVTKP